MAEKVNRFVAYFRVSTDRQGRSGLGLEAQRSAVRAFTQSRGGSLPFEEFTEVESGKRNDRPQLSEAIKICRAYRATLVVAKIDRLSRNAAFLFTLKDSGIDYVAADMPDVNPLNIGVLIIVAQHEQEMISSRTKAALAVAKLRGKRVGGGPGPNPEDAARGRDASVEARRRMANQRAADVLPILARIQAERPDMSLHALAARLNEEEVPTPSGRGKWQAVSVQRLFDRVGDPVAG